MNELETLRGFLQAAMDKGDYDRARQYMYLIESLEEGDDEEDDMYMQD